MAAMVDVRSATAAGLDLHPIGSAIEGTVDLTELPDALDRMLDFDGRTRVGGHIGAHEGPADTAAVPLMRAGRGYATE